MRTIAASIAKEVFTGPMKLLEGPLGFCKNFSDDYDLEKITRNLGEDWMIMGIYFKKHASCSLSHTTMDATLGLADKYPVPIDQVEKVVVKTHRFPSDLNEKAPKTPSAAKASIPFCVSVALHQKRVSLNEFDSGTLENKNIQELARKVDVQLDPVLAGIHLAHEALRSSVLEVHLRSGQVLSEKRDVAKGWAINPMSQKELEEKFQGLAGLSLPEDKRERILRLIGEIEALPNVTSLVKELR